MYIYLNTNLLVRTFSETTFPFTGTFGPHLFTLPKQNNPLNLLNNNYDNLTLLSNLIKSISNNINLITREREFSPYYTFVQFIVIVL